MVTIIWHEQSFHHVFRAWPGPVGRHIDRTGRKTQQIARGIAPKRTGALAASINIRHRRSATLDAQMDVGTNLGGRAKGYSLYTHESAAHRIRARRAPNLVFRVDSGKVIVKKAVNWRLRNPATTKYLTKALRRSV